MNRRERRQAAKRVIAGAAGDGRTGIERARAVAVEHHQAGRLREAQTIYRRILKGRPGDLDTLSLFGVLLHQLGRSEDGIACLRKAIAGDGSIALYHHNLGEIHRELDRPREAVACYRRALELEPENADAHHSLGGALLADGEVDDAIAHYGKAAELRPEDANIPFSLGTALMEKGDLDEAIAAFQAALYLRPGFEQATLALGDARSQLAAIRGKGGAATARDEQANAYQPQLAAAHYEIGLVLQGRGAFEEAVASYRRAMDLAPSMIAPYVQMAASKRFSTRGAEVVRMEALLDSEVLSLDERKSLHFALGKINDDLGCFDQAFAHYRAANDLRRAELEHEARELELEDDGFDSEAHKEFIDASIAMFGADFLVARKGWGSDSELPVFIVGMPRSGTTLVEQIVSRHANVFGAGEITAMRDLVGTLPQRLGSSLTYPACIAVINQDSAHELSDDYLRRLRALSAALRITDKLPANFFHLGLITLLLPRARVIHCARDPLDTCLSCYFQNFDSAHAYAQDLRTLGFYYVQYQRLMAHWREALPIRMLDVRYEDLVADQEQVSRAIIDFLGLDWDAKCLSFHRHSRVASTASQWQVRQPLFASSVGRWRNYEAYLEPLKEALAGGADLAARPRDGGAGAGGTYRPPTREHSEA